LVRKRIRAVAVSGKDHGDALGMPELAVTPARRLLDEPSAFEIGHELAELAWHIDISINLIL
jgi:hypothetical protein